MHNSRSEIEARDEPARHVLTRILAATRNKLTWRAFYYEQMNSYLVSIFVAPQKAPKFDSPPVSLPAATNSSATTVGSVGFLMVGVKRYTMFLQFRSGSA